MSGWECDACTHMNPAGRGTCELCMNPAPAAQAPPQAKVAPPPPSKKWVCSNCSHENDGGSSCELCFSEAPTTKAAGAQPAPKAAVASPAAAHVAPVSPAAAPKATASATVLPASPAAAPKVAVTPAAASATPTTPAAAQKAAAPLAVQPPSTPVGAQVTPSSPAAASPRDIPQITIQTVPAIPQRAESQVAAVAQQRRRSSAGLAPEAAAPPTATPSLAKRESSTTASPSTSKVAPAAPGASGKAKTDILLANSGVLSSKALVNCKMAGCTNPSFALGLCSEHSKAQKESQRDMEAESGARARELLTKGEMFIKYSKSKKPHQVYVKLSPDLSAIRWGDQAKMEKSKSAGKKIRTKDAVAVMKGRGSPIFQKYSAGVSPDAEFVSFSIMYEKGRNKQSTLDLELPCPDDSKTASYRATSLSWEKALKWAINHSGGSVAQDVAVAKGAASTPADPETEARFEKFMDEKCLNPTVRDELRSLTDKAKVEMMLNAEKVEKELSTKGKSEPEYWVQRIHQVFLKKTELEDLKIVLAAAGRTWMSKFAGFAEDESGEYTVEDFPQKNGILGLLNVMTRHQDVNEPEIVFEVLSCLKLLMNNDFGFKLGMLTNNFVTVLCNSLARATDSCRSVALIILTTIAWDSDKGLGEVINALEDPAFPVFQDSGVGLRLLVSMISRLDGHGLGNRHASADFPNGKGGYVPAQKPKKKNFAGAVALWDREAVSENGTPDSPKEELQGVYLSLFEMLAEAQRTQFQVDPAEAPGLEPRESVMLDDPSASKGAAEWKGYRRSASSGRDDIRVKKAAAHVILQLEQRERQLDHHLAAVNERALMFVNTLINSHNDLETRVHFRQRLIELGMLDALARVRGFVERAKGELFETLGCGRLELQCDLFEEEMITDAQRTRWNEIDLGNPADLYSFISTNCATRGTTSYLVAMLQAISVLPVDALRSELAWARVCDIVEFAVTPIAEPEDLLKNVKVDASEYAVGDDGIKHRNPTYDELKAQLDKLFLADKQKLRDKVQALQNYNAKLIEDANAANLKVLQMEQNHRKALEQATKDAALRPWKSPTGVPPTNATANSLCSNCGGVAVGPAGSASAPAPAAGPPAEVPGAPPEAPGAPDAPPDAPGAPDAPPDAPGAPDAPPDAPGAPEAPGAPDGPPGPPGAPGGPSGLVSPRTALLNSLPPGVKPKPKIVPTKKMKNLHWAPIKVQKIAGTVFAAIDDTTVSFEQSQFENLFCQSSSRARDKEPAEKKEPEVKKISLVDGKRGYAVNIALGRIRLPHSTIRDYIFAMDESWLNEEHTQTLLNCMPEPAELERVAQYSGDLALLESVDLFFLGCLKIPNPKVRLECMLFKLRFQQVCDELDQALDLCISQVQALTESRELVRTLEVVLTLGNYLNAGTKNGESYGFDINFLLRLEGTKSQPVEGRVISLLEYLVTLCHQRNKEVCTFWETMHPTLQAAARVENAWLQGQASKLRSGLAQVQQELSRAEKDNHEVDRFYPVMSAFYAGADPKANKIKRKLLSLEQSVASLTKFLGCDAAMDMEGLFKLLSQFSHDWMDAQHKIGADEAKKAREEKKKPSKVEHEKPESLENAGKVDAAMSVLRDSNKDDIRSAITKRRNLEKGGEGGPGRQMPSANRGVSQARLKQYKTISKREGQKGRGGDLD